MTQRLFSCLLIVGVVLLASLTPARAHRQESFEELRARAEAHYAEASFTLAHREYERAADLDLDEADERWVRYRLADTQWRAAAASREADRSTVDAATKELRRLVSEYERPEERDVTWAGAQRSLGALNWRRDQRSMGHAWPAYEAALEYWGSSPDLAIARVEYLGICRELIELDAPNSWRWGHTLGNLPESLFVGAAKVAVDPADRQRTQYWLASFLRRQSLTARTHERTRAAYLAALEPGPVSDEYDDALFHYATWLEDSGVLQTDAERGVWTEPDYVTAAAELRRYLEAYERGESPYREAAQNKLKAILREEVVLSVDRFFLPGSKLAADLQWRNVSEVSFSLYGFDLLKDVELRDAEDQSGSWVEALDLSLLERRARWSLPTEDDGRHAWGREQVAIEQELPPGAYVLEATAGAARARQLVLISSTALVAKTSGDDVLLWVSSVLDGTPLAESEVHLFHRVKNDLPWQKVSARADADGLVQLRLPESGSDRRSYFVVAGKGEQQAFAQCWEPWTWRSSEPWRMYAYTDRSAYRPGQEVSWKLVARRRVDSVYATPAGAGLEWEVRDQSGAVQASGACTLNEFGSASAALTPSTAWPLGLYTLSVFEAGKKPGEHGAGVASAPLFRLEEYKLPEFLVSVEVPESEGGGPLRFHPGDELKATIRADYYFGGAVAQSSAAVLVYRKPYWPTWTPPRDYPWLYDEASSIHYWWGGKGELVHQETLILDDTGAAELRFESGADDGQDYEYTIEALVTDSSRREVSGSGRLRVTRQGWYAYLDPGHSIHRPGDEATVALRALDANEKGVDATGEIALLRRVWRERWISPEGRSFEGDALTLEKALTPGFPPAPLPGKPAWRLEVKGYEDQLISSAQLSIADGEGEWRGRLEEAGYYVLRFSSKDERGVPVLAETALYVATSESRELGERSGGFSLLLDKDTFREGEDAHLLISAPASGRTVLFTVECEGLLETRVVRMDGRVKLLQVHVDERWVPNVYLALTGFHAGSMQSETARVVVPPDEHFLDVEVELLPPTALPGEPAEAVVRVLDREGEPVRSEVSISVVDESVAAIQADLAGDPRQVFYGETRDREVLTRASTNERGYVRLVRDQDGQLEDARQVWAESAVLEDAAGAELGVDLRGLGYLGGGGSGAPSGPARMAKKGASGPSTPGPGGPSAPGARSRDGASEDSFFGAPRAGGGGGEGGGQGAGSGTLEVVVRKDFRETALWAPHLQTGEDGTARVPFTYPDSLTNWRATAKAVSARTDVGEADGQGKTRMPLAVRLQAPRFFVVGDECLVSLNVDNRTEDAVTAQVALEVSGLEVLGVVGPDGQLAEPGASTTVAAGGGERIDWRVRAVAAGEATFKASVTSAEHGDAIERALPVVAHGVPVLEARSGRFDGPGVEVALDLPSQRAEGSTEVFVQVTPSAAITMLDALPYLVDYPYGCTEQTLSRFVPAVVVKRTLSELGLDPADAMSRVFGGVEASTADKTHRDVGASIAELDEVTAASLERLFGMQHGDGSWGWWSGGEGDPFMTGYAVWSLCLAREAGVAVDADRLNAGARWLGEQLVSASGELRAWLLHAHARWMATTGDVDDAQRGFAARAFATAFEERAGLGAYGRALLVLAAVDLGSDQAGLLTRNLLDGVQLDTAPDASVIPLGQQAGGIQSPRAHWGRDGIGYRWSDGGVEATAFALMALVAVDPKHELVEPAADWLISNRRGAQWDNTRSTAVVVLALERYLAATGQLERSVGYSVAVNGEEVGSAQLAGSDLLTAPSRFAVPARLLRDGSNRVEILRTSGSGPLFFSAEARFVSEEEPVLPRGHELFVRRQYFRLVARPTLLSGVVHERVPLGDGESIVSGERVEVVLTFEAKNHLEYLLFEDLKPAGLEATEVKSGQGLRARQLRADETEHRFQDARGVRSGVGARRSTGEDSNGYTGASRWVHQELRDRKVALFLDQCPQGVWEIRYELRAEAPGEFHALPVLGQAMYVPEVRANGAEVRLQVLDREDV